MVFAPVFLLKKMNPAFNFFYFCRQLIFHVFIVFYQ